MSRIISLMAALLLAVALLPAAAQDAGVPMEALGGTSWRSPEGILFHFTGNARLFFSFDQSQPMYHLINGSHYLAGPASDVGGPYLVNDSARRCDFTFDGRTLLVDDIADSAEPFAFTYINYPATLAGTRWLDEHGTIFEFSADSTVFTCGCYGQNFSRTQRSLGAYYEMSAGTPSGQWYDPDAPFAILPDGDVLRVYATKGTLPVLWQTFTRITD